MKKPSPKWVNWNPNKLPKVGVIIEAHVQHFGHRAELRVELKRVKEDDLCFRTTDDNSEFDEMNWQIIKYRELPE